MKTLSKYTDDLMVKEMLTDGPSSDVNMVSEGILDRFFDFISKTVSKITSILDNKNIKLKVSKNDSLRFNKNKLEVSEFKSMFKGKDSTFFKDKFPQTSKYLSGAPKSINDMLLEIEPEAQTRLIKSYGDLIFQSHKVVDRELGALDETLDFPITSITYSDNWGVEENTFTIFSFEVSASNIDNVRQTAQYSFEKFLKERVKIDSNDKYTNVALMKNESYFKNYHEKLALNTLKYDGKSFEDKTTYYIMHLK